MDVDGRRTLGVAADNLAPKWFTKNPETSYRDDAAEMVDVIENACAAAARCRRRESVFDLWHDVYLEQVVAKRSGYRPAARRLRGVASSSGRRSTRSAAPETFRSQRRCARTRSVSASKWCTRSLAGHSARELLPPRPLTRHSRPPHRGLERCACRRRPELDRGRRTACRQASRPASGSYGLRRFKVKVGGDRRLRTSTRLGRVQRSARTGDTRATTG